MVLGYSLIRLTRLSESKDGASPSLGHRDKKDQEALFFNLHIGWWPLPHKAIVFHLVMMRFLLHPIVLDGIKEST